MAALSDAALAKVLQAEFDEEYRGGSNVAESANRTPNINGVNFNQHFSIPSGSSSSSNSQPLSLIDREWELLDPTPDPRALFLQFDDNFFWGKLAGVEVRWSPRMTLCAGVCSYEGRGGLCSIRLSVPLLKLRPRKDLVETLLHEMIHAYLFVTQNNRDRDGHGPEFCKHKDRINKDAGTKITVYHSFHDEVDNYRQHWWRCDGPCQQRKPYFGYVKRAMNRAPSHHDNWWADHQQKCGGTYTKIKEPDGYTNKKRKKEDSSKENTENQAADKKPKRESYDIRDFVPFGGQGHKLGGSDSSKSKGESSEAARRQDIPSHQKENRNPAQFSKTECGDTSKPRQNGKDFVRTKKKLEELKAIFLSSSEDEDDENDDGTLSPREKDIKEKKDLNKKTSVRAEVDEVGRERLKHGGGQWRKKIGGEDGERMGQRTAAGISVPSGSGVVRATKRDDRDASRGLSGRTAKEDSNSSGQTSLHHVVERMKSNSVEITDSSQLGNTEGTSGCEKKTVSCPVCGSRVIQSQINVHLDSCLSS